MRYPFVLFDIGDTLIGPSRSYGAVYSTVLAELGLALSPERLERGIRQTAAELARRIPPGTDRFSFYSGGEKEFWARFCHAVLKAAGHTADEDLDPRVLDKLRQAFLQRDAWCVYDDVVPTLKALRAAGCRLGVVSNWDSRLEEVLRILGLSEYFETIGVSGLEGVEKPDPRFFRRVLGRLNAAADEALHVGNAPELDLAGAASAGVDALLVDRAGSVDPSHRPLPDLWELPQIVRGGIR